MKKFSLRKGLGLTGLVGAVWALGSLVSSEAKNLRGQKWKLRPAKNLEARAQSENPSQKITS